MMKECVVCKTCRKCKETKPISEFHNNKATKDGKTSRCKICRTEAAKKWNAENWDRHRKNTSRWVKNNRDKVLIHSRRIEKKRVDYHKTKHNNYFTTKQKENPELYFLKCQADNCCNFYYSKGGGSQAKYCGKVCRNKTNYEKYYSTIEGKLCTSMRVGIKKGLVHKKEGRTFEILEYTLLDLIEHLESLFDKPKWNGYQWVDDIVDLSWDNRSEWHIDHIRPVASFNFDSTEHPDFKKCWALNNLQPLWAADNIRKGDKWDGIINR